MFLDPNPSALPSMSWQDHGLCRDLDADVFFPPLQPEERAQRDAREAQAKAICSRCVVQAECLEWALSTGEPYGVWGGASERDRKRMLMRSLKAG